MATSCVFVPVVPTMWPSVAVTGPQGAAFSGENPKLWDLVPLGIQKRQGWLFSRIPAPPLSQGFGSECGVSRVIFYNVCVSGGGAN